MDISGKSLFQPWPLTLLRDRRFTVSVLHPVIGISGYRGSSPFPTSMAIGMNDACQLPLPLPLHSQAARHATGWALPRELQPSRCFASGITTQT